MPNRIPTMTGKDDSYDFDWLVIGSGFGGSVSALRLSEKGHAVGVLECGRRFADDELPKSTADLKRYFWNPLLGMKGIFRLTTFKDVSVVSGCGVGGGSLGYANTLYVPPKAFFEDRQWGEMEDWEATLAPHYAEAQRMLGVVQNPHDDPADQLLRELGEELGVGDTYKKTPVGVYFGEPGETVADPFFGGEGPERTGCRLCGRCMVGCPHGAKNTLVKNYLYFAEKRGARVMPERTVLDIRPIGSPDGADGYEVESVRSGAWLRKERRVQRARGVVVSAGPLGTNKLLQRCRAGRLAAAHLRAPGRARADKLRVDPHGDRARGLPAGPDPPCRDQLVDLPGPEHAHRDGHLWRRRRLDAPPVHAARRRRHARDATAEAAGADRAAPQAPDAGAVPQALVAAHDHHPRDADARQRDRAAPAQRAVRLAAGCGPNRTPSDRTRRSSRSPTRRRSGSPSAPAGSRRARSPRRCSTSPRRRTSSAAR